MAAGAVATAEWDEAALSAAADDGFSTATGVADLLAMEGVPFRTAHEMVALAAESGGDYEALAAAAESVLDEPLSEHVSREAVEAALDPEASVASRDSAGGPAREAVEAALADARGGIEADRETVESRRAALSAADAELRSEVAAYV